jgi:hypothetical protein
MSSGLPEIFRVEVIVVEFVSSALPEHGNGYDKGEVIEELQACGGPLELPEDGPKLRRAKTLHERWRLRTSIVGSARN